MRTETEKTFRRPFIVTEETLRRIVDCMDEQIAKVATNGEVVHLFEARLRSGALMQSDRIDDILFEDNVGSRTPEMVRVTISTPETAPVSKLAILFETALGEDEIPQVECSVLGDDRDWVLVTTSHLEERLSTTTRGRFVDLVARREVAMAGNFLMMLGMLAFLVYFAYSFPGAARTHSLQGLTEIRKAWRSGQLSDPAEVTIRVAEARVEDLQQLPSTPVAIGMAVLFSLLIISMGCWMFRKPLLRSIACGFSWGDNGQALARRIRRWQIFWVAVVLALLISIVGSIVGPLLIRLVRP